MRIKKLVTAVIASLACLGAVATPSFAWSQAVSDQSWAAATHVCLHYTGCHNLTYSPGSAWQESNGTVNADFYFYTAYFGFCQVHTGVYPNLHGYGQAHGSCGWGYSF